MFLSIVKIAVLLSRFNLNNIDSQAIRIVVTAFVVFLIFFVVLSASSLISKRYGKKQGYENKETNKESQNEQPTPKVDRLIQLKEMRDNQDITEEEFDMLKNELLNTESS